MKCTLVNFTAPITASHRPGLSPELMASVGARYSRSDEGLDMILSKVDFGNPDKSVDSIFKMVDYGHASIGDMAPLAIFIDGISLLCAFWLWYICPTASGQESSTRYIKYNSSSMLDIKEVNDVLADYDISSDDLYGSQHLGFDCYDRSYMGWMDLAKRDPLIMRIPSSLQSTDEKKWLRMVRNYAFDRARVFIPLSSKTNMMMVQSARSWVDTISYMLSHPLKEFRVVGESLRDELNLACPRLTKHAVAKESTSEMIKHMLSSISIGSYNIIRKDHGAKVKCDISSGISSELELLKFRENRYSLFPRRWSVQPITFGWKHASFGEIRDLNRHRTGGKEIIWAPNGFYPAVDEVPLGYQSLSDKFLGFSSGPMKENFERCNRLLKDQKFEGLYMLSLGHTFDFTHSTTLDKYCYEAELRTGLGAHYVYSRMLHGTMDLLEKKLPGISRSLHLGTAEPEI